MHQGAFGFLFAILTLGALKQRKRRAPNSQSVAVVLIVWRLELETRNANLPTTNLTPLQQELGFKDS
jgi:hypothetical protein